MIPNKDGIIVSSTEPTTDRRKVWFQKGKNLFDGQYNTGYGYSQETGKRIVLANIYSNKNLIAIPSGATKVCLSKNGIGISVRIFFYDEDENFITSTAVFENPYVVNIAENARYCNFQTATSNADNDFTNIQFEFGTDVTIIPTEYENYVVPKVFIKNNEGLYEEFMKKEQEQINIITGVEYATNEYIDGNRVYRKRMFLGNGPDSSLSRVYPIGIQAYNIIKIDLTMKQNTTFIPVPVVNADAKAFVNYYMDGTNLIIQAGRDRSSFLVRAEIYYIK